MRNSRRILIVFLVGLFLSLSFNAYACLVPIYGGMKVSHGSDCTTPGEEPASQFCQGFKSLAVQSGPDISSPDIPNLVLAEKVPFFFPGFVTSSQFFPIATRGQVVPPKDTLVLNSVFRI
ncbi:hypothetical protein [Candidatus Nitronereus thalassa]|uniref:Uncharacterized protein n=1 Tax=Candidatus Nitronereus thalassa TaxID=3020898 RepID=A0ABU3K328_9BACT|nr:hypothetical protein [Candidatus Nitronereus thalassa]MDT7040786.1 hypothetical protein [Candidatus Nitronereus thalassa]